MVTMNALVNFLLINHLQRANQVGIVYGSPGDKDPDWGWIALIMIIIALICLLCIMLK